MRRESTILKTQGEPEGQKSIPRHPFNPVIAIPRIIYFWEIT